jgi:hypothetical protein
MPFAGEPGLDLGEKLGDTGQLDGPTEMAK